VALVDRNVDKHQVRDVAEAFLSFLQGAEAKRSFNGLGFRPVQTVGQAAGPGPQPASSFPLPSRLFTIAELGGWVKVEGLIFGPQGVWTRVVEEVAREK
jgi:sulfate transport system substrate-binding protein